MYATEVEIDTYLNLLIPTTSIDIDCPICHEPYPEYDQGTATDYAVWPTERQEDTRCRHIFGRLCIEQHVRSGRDYSTRCPICRELWIGDSAQTPTHMRRWPQTNEWYRVPRNRRRGAVGVVPPNEEDESSVVVVSRDMMED
jgi:hypothetical protein